MGAPGIPPYRMNQLIKVASKVSDQMVNGIFHLTYEEIDVVLELIRVAAERSKEIKEGEHVFKDSADQEDDEGRS